MEEIKRHFGVAAESLRSDIQQIAEGHAEIRSLESDVSSLKSHVDRLESN